VARGNRPLAPPPGITLREVGHLSDLVKHFASPGGGGKPTTPPAPARGATKSS